MTNTEGSNRLPVLAADIRRHHAAVGEAVGNAVRYAIKAGEALIEAKKAVGHGNWLPWLREHCEISERTAQTYMRLAKHEDEIEIRSEPADLTIEKALDALATPKAIEPESAVEGIEPKTAIEWIVLQTWQIHPRVVFHPCGMQLPDDLTIEQWRSIVELIAPLVRASMQ
jgi:Protein of unknown function (DUF3102)